MSREFIKSCLEIDSKMRREFIQSCFQIDSKMSREFTVRVLYDFSSEAETELELR